MAIWAHHDTRVLCQGLTGRQGTFHTRHAIASRMVGGVTPGKGGPRISDFPCSTRSHKDAKYLRTCPVAARNFEEAARKAVAAAQGAQMQGEC